MANDLRPSAIMRLQEMEKDKSVPETDSGDALQQDGSLDEVEREKLSRPPDCATKIPMPIPNHNLAVKEPGPSALAAPRQPCPRLENMPIIKVSSEDAEVKPKQELVKPQESGTELVKTQEGATPKKLVIPAASQELPKPVDIIIGAQSHDRNLADKP